MTTDTEAQGSIYLAHHLATLGEPVDLDDYDYLLAREADGTPLTQADDDALADAQWEADAISYALADEALAEFELDRAEDAHFDARMGW
jgi:hypothetical protein